ncbi:hypothetical protein TR631_33920 [Streptomyces rochei]|uniref:hypothetical protein n=1 Tax=Streptomyces TaxID=1883 RepID=UPI000F78E94B|nr:MULTISPECIES: hypothetical protein [Streptomyces]RSS92444.1 hypothetical protein EF919_18085 [Streptomyces sp. WAC02707]WQC16562.1 hypothetical protein TR631_33920 [Streptomyces rochei]
MADMTTPFYKLQATSSGETGFVLTMRIEEGAGGPLAGWDTTTLLDAIRSLLKGDDPMVQTALVLTETKTTTL